MADETAGRIWPNAMRLRSRPCRPAKFCCAEGSGSIERPRKERRRQSTIPLNAGLVAERRMASLIDLLGRAEAVLRRGSSPTTDPLSWSRNHDS